MLLVEYAGHLGHPLLTVGTEEFPFWWERSGVLERAGHDVPEVVGRGCSIFEDTTTTYATELPMQQ